MYELSMSVFLVLIITSPNQEIPYNIIGYSYYNEFSIITSEYLIVTVFYP